MARQTSDDWLVNGELEERDAVAKDALVHEEQAVRGIDKPEGVTAESRVLWEYLGPVIAFHLLIPLAFLPSLFSWWGVAWLFVGNFLFTSLGIGAGYHRLLTHRGFECPKWFEYVLTTLGVCSFQDSPARWVLVHRVHHQHSDHQNDPHTPKVSAFWSHMGWMFVDNKQLSTVAAYDKYTRDVMRDPYYRWLQRGLNWVWVYVAHGLLFGGVALGVGLAIGQSFGDAFWLSAVVVFWGVLMRTIFTWHVTWGINSFAHMWGYRNYETREDSRNNWMFAFLTNGEGWHNNHHADPRSARHGHRWWEIDLTWQFLRAAEAIGLVKKLVRPNQRALDRKVIA
ncbi:MAG: fatty acid desaturase [Planctomycetota bacterium]